MLLLLVCSFILLLLLLFLLVCWVPLPVRVRFRPSLLVSLLSLLLFLLDPAVASVSPRFTAQPSSLPPPSVAPKVPQASPSASFAATSYSHPTGLHVSVGSYPDTSGTSDYSPDNVLHYADDDVRSSKDDSDYNFRQGCVFQKLSRSD